MLTLNIRIQEWQRQQADAKAKADTQAAAQAAAVAHKKQEIESILGKYTGSDDEPGLSATYTDNLSDAEVSQAREMDRDLHGRIMG